jgi:hypothetical protein
MVWKRFQVFVDNWQTNYDLCMAWFAVQKAKKSYPRPIPDKFDCTLTETELEAHNLKTYFREYCKNGVWELASDEWKLYWRNTRTLHRRLAFLLRQYPPSDQAGVC